MKQTGRKKLFCLVIVSALLLSGGCCRKKCTGSKPVRVKQSGKTTEIDNDLVKARFTISQEGISQEYFAKKKDKWVLVAKSFKPATPFPENANAIYNSDIDKAHRLMVTELVDSIQIAGQCKKQARVVLSGKSDAATVTQTIELAAGKDHFHIEVDAALDGQPPKLEYLLSPFVLNIEGKPDYTHAPSLKRNPRHKAEDDPSNLIGDRAFFSPAAIVQKDSIFVAVVPDVDIINESVIYAKDARPQKHPKVFSIPVDADKISMPTALDLELESTLTPNPLVSYGMIDFQVQQHVYYYHDNTKDAMVRELSSNKIRYGMDLFVSADAPQYRGYQRVARHMWARYGTVNLGKPHPQAMPYSEYAKVCYPAAFSHKGSEIVIKNGLPDKVVHRDGPAELESWQQWEIDGVPVGGLRLSAPQWYDLVYFASWWNNIYDSVGMYLWGKQLGDETLIDKSRRTVNLILTAPQKEGMFPAYYDLKEKQWVRNLWKFPLEGYDPSEYKHYWGWDDPNATSYQTASASVTAGFLMKYRVVCEDNERIIPFVKNYADFLIKNMQPDGSVPAWFDKELSPLPSLRWNADGGAHIWVLSELYHATKEDKYLVAAKKIAHFMINEVLPEQKWYDFEAFYSCAAKEETFRDNRTGQPPRNLMSAGWAMQGFTSLYKVTDDKAYLETAEAIADFVSFFQAVWAPHYIITAYPFGGLSSQVGDAEWLDQRTHRFAQPLVHIGLLTNRSDLVERGVAAMRSVLALVNHPRHIKNKIYEHPNYPLGMGPENIDHEGNPQMPLRSGPSWAEVGGLAAAAELASILGDVYVNVEKNIAIGINGVKVTGFKFDNRTVSFELKNQLAAFPFSYEKAFKIDLKVEGLPDTGQYTLIINNGKPIKATTKELLGYQLKIQP